MQYLLHILTFAAIGGVSLSANASLLDDSIAKSVEAEQMAAQQIYSALTTVSTGDQRKYCFNLGEGAAEAYFILTSRGPDYTLSVFVTDRNIAKIYAEIDELARRNCDANVDDVFASIQTTDWTDFDVKLIEKIYPLRTAFAQNLLQQRSSSDDQEECGSRVLQPLSLHFAMGASDILNYNATSFGDAQRVISLENGRKKLSTEQYKHNFRYRFGYCN